MTRRPAPLPVLLADLTLASWETMAHRIGSIARGTCTAREYRRMVTEKLLTAQRSALAMMLPRGDRLAAALAPWRSAAMRNAKRLRKRRR